MTGSRDAYLRRTYGISQVDYDALLEYQGGRCYVCHQKPGRSLLAVDHDHTLPPGRDSVRGLLCARSARSSSGRTVKASCNEIVGAFRDNPRAARRLADYLESPPWRRLEERREAEALNEAQSWQDALVNDGPSWMDEWDAK